MATIEVAGDSRVLVSVPAAAAKALDSSDANEPRDADELLARVRQACDASAWERVLGMASRRERSADEVRSRLRQDGYAGALVERVVERARAKRVVDDTRFADSFIRAKLAAGWGPCRIERELGLRGVAPDELEGWPGDYLGGETFVDRALGTLRARRTPEAGAYPKLVRFLLSRGYPVSTAREAVGRFLSEATEDEG